MNATPSLIAFALLAAACQAPAPDLIDYQLLAMGTSVELSVATGDEADLDASITDIESMLRDYERDYYAWADGELAKLNASLGSGEAFEASAEMASLISDAQRLSAASGGSFEPGVAPLVEAWGFHRSETAPTSAPEQKTVAGILGSLAGIGSLDIQARTVRAMDGPVMLDLGGIAKGRAVDRIISLLASRGFSNSLVNAGGDLRVLGSPPGRYWRIGIQSPRSEQTLATIELHDGEAAFTSGDYERFFDSENGRMHHLLDPSTGFPATHTQAVTVIASDGTTADAAATALFVAGPRRWQAVASGMGIVHVLRVDNSGFIEVSSAMRERLQISKEYQSVIIVARP
jgi:thiamine biosynthesis lipoprotein